MKTQLIKNGRKWLLYSAVLAGMVYSAMTLTCQPAYAGTCTPAECAGAIQYECQIFCQYTGGERQLQCPTGNPIYAACTCNDDQLKILGC
jgi:hypothetical protein